MLQAKYLKYGTCWIITIWVIRDQLAELYILKKEFLISAKKILSPSTPKTLYIVYVTSQISQVWYMLDSNNYGYS